MRPICQIPDVETRRQYKQFSHKVNNHILKKKKFHMLEIIDKYIFYIDAILQLIPCSGRIKDVLGPSVT